jgi:hypothetical protein
MPKVARHLHLVTGVGQIRTGQWHGSEMLIVPVTALMEGVLHAVNAPSAEFVPYSSLIVAPQGWNGRPIVLDHPAENGRQISANDPRVLEAKSFGTVFNTSLRDRKLLMEAWINTERAARVAPRVLARIRAGEMVEVSVGVFVTAEAREGEFQGKTFHAIWRDIIPDHLAFLSEGDTGACSIAMGCGAPRAAKAYVFEGEEIELIDVPEASDAEIHALRAAGGPGSGITGHTTPQGEAVAKAHDAAAQAHRSAATAHRAAAKSTRRGENFYDSEAGTSAANTTNSALEKTQTATEAHEAAFGDSQASDNNPDHYAEAQSHADDAVYKETHTSAADTHDRAAAAHEKAAAAIRSGKTVRNAGGPGSGPHPGTHVVVEHTPAGIIQHGQPMSKKEAHKKGMQLRREGHANTYVFPKDSKWNPSATEVKSVTRSAGAFEENAQVLIPGQSVQVNLPGNIYHNQPGKIRSGFGDLYSVVSPNGQHMGTYPTASLRVTDEPRNAGGPGSGWFGDHGSGKGNKDFASAAGAHDVAARAHAYARDNVTSENTAKAVELSKAADRLTRDAGDHSTVKSSNAALKQANKSLLPDRSTASAPGLNSKNEHQHAQIHHSHVRDELLRKAGLPTPKPEPMYATKTYDPGQGSMPRNAGGPGSGITGHTTEHSAGSAEHAASGLPNHEVITHQKPLTDLGKTSQRISVESKFVLGKGSKRSPVLLAKKAELQAKGWNVEHGTKGGNKNTWFHSPAGHTPEQAHAEFNAAGKTRSAVSQRFHSIISDIRSAKRIDRIQDAAEAIRAAGDVPGHEFHGNQYSHGGGGIGAEVHGGYDPYVAYTKMYLSQANHDKPPSASQSAKLQAAFEVIAKTLRDPEVGPAMVEALQGLHPRDIETRLDEFARGEPRAVPGGAGEPLPQHQQLPRAAAATPEALTSAAKELQKLLADPATADFVQQLLAGVAKAGSWQAFVDSLPKGGAA